MIDELKELAMSILNQEIKDNNLNTKSLLCKLYNLGESNTFKM